MGHVASIWRHPIKSHGREALETVTLTKGQTMPWDRHWAVTHDETKFDASDPAWVMCRNFMIGTATPDLAGLWCALDEATATLTLRHASLGSLTFSPDDPAEVRTFIAWITPLCPADKRQPRDFACVPGRGMTDSDYPSVSIMTTASHRAVEGRMGRKLEQERWRGNIWLDGPDAWEELEWIGGTIRIGDATLKIHEPIRRCAHTTANPHSGKRDADTLGVLRESWDHQNFGVYATVIDGGTLSLGDPYKVL